MVPAEAFGQGFTEWRQGHSACIDARGRPFRGRHCAAKTNLLYRHIEADLHNLVPEIGEINALRSNLPIGAVVGSSVILRDLTAKLGGGVFEPPPEARGPVARVHLYMNSAYPELHLLSEQRKRLFVVWSKQQPASGWECERNVRVTDIQGNSNPFVLAACKG